MSDDALSYQERNYESVRQQRDKLALACSTALDDLEKLDLCQGLQGTLKRALAAYEQDKGGAQ